MSESNQHHNNENKEQPKFNWILVTFFAIAVFIVFVVLTFIVLNLLNVKNIILEYIVVFFVGSGMGYTIYRCWASIRLFISPPRTPEDKKKDKYGFARDAFLLGSGAIYFNFLILLFYRNNLDFIRSYTEIYTLTWSTAAATKISIGVFAIFAFIVTVWRGNLHAAQVDSQIKQLEQGNKQLHETENNNVAKLLVDGTKLLGEDTSEAEKMAGIACLANIMAGTSSFAKQAAMSLQIFIKNINEKTNGIDITKSEYIIFALDVLNEYAEKSSVLIKLTRVTLINDENNAIIGFWPNIHGINYRNFKFKNILFNKSMANFYIENCYFFRCRIKSLYRMQALPYIEKITFEDQFGEMEVDIDETFDFPSTFWACVFDCGEDDIKNSFFIRDMITKQRHDLEPSCVYDDRYVRDAMLKQFFESKGIKPFNSLTAEERLKVGPQKTT